MSSFTSNPFALLDDDESPQKAPQQKMEQRTASPSKKPAAATATGKPANNKATRPPRNEYPRRGGFRGSVGNAEGSEGKLNNEEGEKRQRHHGPRRGQRGGWHGRGREFERHSGMPRDTEKKAQSGWGQAPTSEEESRKEEDVATAGQDEQQVTSPPVEEVEEAPVKTLDDYLAEKAAQKLQVSLPAPRRANEGSDESKWKNAVPLQREEEEEVYFVLNKEQPKKKSQATKQPSKVAVPMEQTFFDAKPARGGPRDGARGGRGGRGGNRGGNRGGQRGQSRAFAPNVNDASAFPILTK